VNITHWAAGYVLAERSRPQSILLRIRRELSRFAAVAEVWLKFTGLAERLRRRRVGRAVATDRGVRQPVPRRRQGPRSATEVTPPQRLPGRRPTGNEHRGPDHSDSEPSDGRHMPPHGWLMRCEDPIMLLGG
jgi:hypothetical protein